MNKELGRHFLYTLFLVVLLIVVNSWFDLSYWPVLVGAAVGAVLPDADHLIYSFFLKPRELSSQRVGSLARQKQIKRMVEVVYQTKGDRKGLIFHSALFQLIFVVLSFLVVTSSGSIVGTGLVLASMLHLWVDQLEDYKTKGTIKDWFARLNISLDTKQERVYLWSQLVILLIFVVML